MLSANSKRETGVRTIENLRRLMGESVGELLQQGDVTDIHLNPPMDGESEGRIWVTRLGHEPEAAGTMDPDQAEAFVSAVASTMDDVATKHSPVVEGILLVDGSRFEGLIPPVVPVACFAIRRRASAVFPLSSYVNRGQMTVRQKEKIEAAVLNRENILICGGTGSGKSTLMNSVIDAVVRLSPSHRIIGIEDTVELQCSAENSVFMRASPAATIQDLLKASMRMFPDRILIGEVRGKEALDMLMAWNTGHPGGCATIHSNTSNPRAALSRLELLVSMATRAPMQKLIAEAVNLIVCIERGQKGDRKVTQMVSVEGFDGTDYALKQEIY